MAELDYNWDGGSVEGGPTRLPDGDYVCYVSNAPLDASFTWIGTLSVAGEQLELGSQSGAIRYTSTTDVDITGAGLDSATRTVVVKEPDGTIALWIRFQKQAARCAA